MILAIANITNFSLIFFLASDPEVKRTSSEFDDHTVDSTSQSSPTTRGQTEG